MKNTLSVFVCCLVGWLAQAQAPDFAWARTLGNTGVTVGSLLATDQAGNTYVAGAYSSTLTLGAVTLPYSGVGPNQFVAKYSAAGSVLWAKKISVAGVQDSKNPDKMAVDVAGNVYITGTFASGDMVDTITVPVLAEGQGYGLVKFDADGHVRWLRLATTADSEIGTSSSLRLNAQGNICLTGLFNTTISFDGGVVLNNTDNVNGVDAYRATYDASGNLLEAIRLGVVNPSFAANMAYPVEIFRLDRQGNLYRLVVARKTVLKYAPDGTLLATKVLSVSGAATEINSMDIDGQGNIFLGGWFYNGNATIEDTLLPKVGSNAYADAILLKLDAEGQDMLWLKHYSYTYSDSYSQVRTDELGNVYAMGQYAPGVGDVNSLLIKYKNNGDLLWQQIIVPGSGGTNPPVAIVAAQNTVLAKNGGNVLVVGYYKERIYFDAATFFVNPAGVYKLFVAQYGICETPVPQIQTSATHFCTGDSVQLTALPPATYVWSTGEVSDTLFTTQPGHYYAVAVEGEECYATSSGIDITMDAIPAITVTQTGFTLTAAETGDTYQWLDCNNNHTPIPGATAPVFEPAQDGQYAVSIANGAGCADTSACFTVSGMGIGESAWQSNIRLFPNPAQNTIQLGGNVPVTNITVYSALGAPVLKMGNVAGMPVNVSSLAPGTYFISAETGQGVWRGKFVKQ